MISGAAAKRQLSSLEERLERYPRHEYPVQHATALLHLGLLLAGTQELARAETALCDAAKLFLDAGMPAEHGKVMNALGAVLRTLGRVDEARAVFERAAAALHAAGLESDMGAALYNLALVLRQSGDRPGALAALQRAGAVFDLRGFPRHAAAVMRETSAINLEIGCLDAALATARLAVDVSERARDARSAGEAHNLLGLALLAAGSPSEAAEAFAAATARSPRSVRPEAFALCKSNLALAHERRGDAARARLAARQALSVPDAAEPVLVQARGVLDRMGEDENALGAVLDDEEREGRMVVLREEAARMAAESEPVRNREIRSWIACQVGPGGSGADLAELWLGALLELPPHEMEALISSTLSAVSELRARDREVFRSQMSSAMARFNVPQWMRLKDTCNRLAESRGAPTEWG